MEKAWLREFNSIGLQLRPQAAKSVSAFLKEIDIEHSREKAQSTAERLAELTRAYFRSGAGNSSVIDKAVIESVIEQWRLSESSKGLQSDNDGMAIGAPVQDVVMEDAKRGIDAMGLSEDGIEIYHAMHDVLPFDYLIARKEWAASHLAPRLLAGAESKAEIYRARYGLLWQRLFLKQDFISAAHAEEAGHCGSLTFGKSRVVTPVESLAGNPGKKLTFGLLTKFVGEQNDGWQLEDLHKVVPTNINLQESDRLITAGSFVLAEGEMRDGKFHINRIEIPEAVSRQESNFLDQIPPGIFGGSLNEGQLKEYISCQPDGDNGMFVVLSDVHLDDFRVLQKLGDLFQGYEGSEPPAAYVFFGNFRSTPFSQTAESVQSYREGFERLQFLLMQLPKHHAVKTRFIFVPGPQDPGIKTLPRPPLADYLTAGLAKAVPNVHVASNPCRIRTYGKELVFFRHDVLRSLRRHEAVRLREPGEPSAPSQKHVREEMVRLLLDQAHLAPLPLEQANILWSFDHTLRLYPLPDAVVVASGTEGFDVTYKDCDFISAGSFRANSEFGFYAYYPFSRRAEPCGIPDRAG